MPKKDLNTTYLKPSYPLKGVFRNKKVLSPNMIQDQLLSNVEKQPSRGVEKKLKNFSLNV